MPISVKEIAWVAGLLEGEGYFGVNNASPRIQLAMTDLDVIEKARDLIGKNQIISTYTQEGLGKDGHLRKPKYTLTITGQIAIEWMMTIYTFMGTRRKAKIRHLIDFWKFDKVTGQFLLSLKKLGFSDEKGMKILERGL